SFGLVAEKLAEMAIAIFVGETSGYRTTGLLDQALARAKSDPERVAAIAEYTVESSIIKVYGSEALNLCADETVQIHGGYGFIEEFEAARIFRDSRINRIFEGTNEINRLIVPGTLLKRAASGENPLLEYSQTVRERVAAGNLPKPGKGDLAIEEQVAELCKWLCLYTTSVAVETFQLTVADQQEILGQLADMLIRTYALDSCVQRVRQMNESGDPRRTAIDRDLLTAFAPRAFGAILHSGRHVLMDILDGEALEQHLTGMAKLYMAWPSKVIAAKRRIAQQVIEDGGYPLAVPGLA